MLASKEGSIQVPVDGAVGELATERGALTVMQWSVFNRLGIRPTGAKDEMMDAGEILSRIVAEGLVSYDSPINTAFAGQVVFRVNGLRSAAQ